MSSNLMSAHMSAVVAGRECPKLPLSLPTGNPEASLLPHFRDSAVNWGVNCCLEQSQVSYYYILVVFGQRAINPMLDF